MTTTETGSQVTVPTMPQPAPQNAMVARIQSEIDELEPKEREAWIRFTEEAQPLQTKIDAMRSEWCNIRTRIAQLKELKQLAESRSDFWV